MGEGSREAEAPQPEEHRRRAAAAGDQGVDRAARSVQDSQRAGTARALRGVPRELQQDHQRRGATDGADCQPLHPAGGARIPAADRRERRCR